MASDAVPEGPADGKTLDAAIRRSAPMNNHQRGIYQPLADNVQDYELADEEAEDEERSRVPLMIVVAMIVLAAFTGVVWLAYNQGVARGRAGAAVVINAPDGPVRTAPTDAGGTTPFVGLKIYSQPVPPDQEAEGSSVAQTSPASESSVRPAAVPAPIPAPRLTTDAPPVRLDPPITPPAPTSAPAARVAQAPPPKPAAQTPPPAPPAPKPAAAQAAPPAPAAPPPAPRLAAAQAVPPARAPVSPPPAPRIAVTQAPTPIPLSATSPPAAAAPDTSPTGNAVARSGKAVLQIGAFESVALADGAWNAFKARHADLVSDLSEDVQQVDLGVKGVMYRLRMGPFQDRPAAVAACEKLKAQGATCFVAAP
jgi:hypothetical protein